MADPEDPRNKNGARHSADEMRVHQVGLEIRNHELGRTRLELSEQRSKYFDLSDC